MKVPSGELFIRGFLSPTLAAEVSVGTRQYSYYEFGGTHTDSYDLRQTPVFIGLTGVFNEKGVFRPLLAGGLAIVPSSYSGYSYVYPGPAAYISGRTTEAVLWAGAGFSIYFPRSPLILDVGVRYVFGDDSSYAADSPSQRYVRLQLGIGYRF